MKHLNESLIKFCIDGTDYWISKHVFEIKAVDLLSELKSTPHFPKFYWDHRDNQEKKAAFGSLLSFSEVPSVQIAEPGQGDHFDPCFYGALPFDDNSPQEKSFEDFSKPYFFLPEYVVITKNSNFLLESYQIFDQCPHRVQVKVPQLTYTSLGDLNSISIQELTHNPSKEDWSQKIQDLIYRIETTSIDKAVIARKTTLVLSEEICPFELLKNLDSSSSGTLFCFQKSKHMTFLGASPECLYSRTNHHITTEALAGTFSKNSNQSLNKSPKEHHEFKYVSDFLSKALQKFTHEILETSDHIKDMGYLKHIHRGYKAALPNHINDAEIIKRLFPSPALCGHPKEMALDEIRKLEDFNRHFYAAPIGWSSANAAEFVIGIRSCILEKQALHVFVGNGIVSQSDPLKEWEELDVKVTPFLNLIEYART